MPTFDFRLHEVPVRERNHHNNQTWINYFKDRMLIFTLDFMRYYLVKEIITITRQSLILQILIGESKEFVKHCSFMIISYYSKSLIKSPIFSIMHNNRKICILPNFSHLLQHIYMYITYMYLSCPHVKDFFSLERKGKYYIV